MARTSFASLNQDKVGTKIQVVEKLIYSKGYQHGYRAGMKRGRKLLGKQVIELLDLNEVFEQKQLGMSTHAD